MTPSTLLAPLRVACFCRGIVGVPPDDQAAAQVSSDRTAHITREFALASSELREKTSGFIQDISSNEAGG